MKSHIRRVQILIFILLHCGSCQGLELNGVIGKDIILHCATTELEEENVQVLWKDGSSNDVIMIHNNEQTVFNQDLNGRVTSFPGEYKNGNFSIKISKLRLDDAGYYECNIPKQHLEVQYELKVTAEEKKRQMFRESDADTVQANLLGMFVGFLIILLF